MRFLILLLSLCFLGQARGASMGGVAFPRRGMPKPPVVTVSAPSVDTNTSILVYYNLDAGTGSTITDNSGSGHTATASGYTWDNSQVSGNKIIFTTSGSTTVGAPDIGESSLTQVSWSFFYRRTAANNTVIVADGTSAGEQFKFHVKSDGLAYIYCEASGSTSYGTYSSNDTNWHHVAILYDGTQSGNSARLVAYQDNVAKTLSFTGTIPAALSASLNAFKLGYDNSPTFSDGDIDEVRVFARILNSSEILFFASWGADTFNRADQTPLATTFWNFLDTANDPNSRMDLSSNTLVPHAAGFDSSQYMIGRAWATNLYGQCTLSVSGGSAGTGPGLSFRNGGAGSTNCYNIVAINGTIEIAAHVPGYHLIKDISHAWVNGDTLRVDCTGTGTVNFVVYINGVQIDTASDSTWNLNAGYPGVFYSSSSTTAVIDNASFGALQ